MKTLFGKALAIMTLIIGTTGQTHAATWYWYGTDTDAYGGDGPWNNESLVWRSHPANPLTNWVAGNIARFLGDPGTVTLETNIQISANLDVNADMTFEGPGRLMLSGGTLVGTKTATVNCDVVLLASSDIRNNYVINGDISDDGSNRSITHVYDTLTLNGSNSYGGGLNLNNGTLVIGNDHALGTGNLKLGYDGATLEAGGGSHEVTNKINWNWNWRLNFQGTNDLTFTTPQTLSGTAPPYPRFNIVETNAVLTYGGLMQSTYNTKMVKEGPGTFVIQGPYNASHGTVVTGGTLIVNGVTTSVKNNYGYTIWDGATLGGTGVVNLAASGSTCTVHQAGALAPGTHRAESRVGTLTVNGPVSLDEEAIFKCDVQDGASDLLEVNGTLTLPSVAIVAVTLVSGELPESSTIMTADTLAGAGAADISGWMVRGAPGTRLKILENTVILEPFSAGTLILIR